MLHIAVDRSHDERDGTGKHEKHGVMAFGHGSFSVRRSENWILALVASSETGRSTLFPGASDSSLPLNERSASRVGATPWRMMVMVDVPECATAKEPILTVARVPAML